MLPFPDYRHFPFDFDVLLQQALSSTGLFAATSGVLDPSGQSRTPCLVTIPPITELKGVAFWGALIVLNLSSRSGVRVISPVAKFEIT